MSSPVFLPSSDEAIRREAVDPTQSFTVRAPAGSGKTELLIQRYLRLLAVVERPEAIVAITFTKKAAGEMLARILDALRNAELPAEKPHEEWTKKLARAALARDREMGWNLQQHPGRLRVQTIDSLCLSIAGEMPWTSRMGAMPRIEEDTRILYSEAAWRALMAEDPEYEEALEVLLEHLDNNAARARDLIAAMLAKRDQWMDMAFSAADEQRPILEEALAHTVSRRLEEVSKQIPEDVREDWVRLARHGAVNQDEGDRALMQLVDWPVLDSSALDVWKALGKFPVTGSGWRKTVNRNHGFIPKHAAKTQAEALFAHLAALDDRSEGDLRRALKTLSRLPAPHIPPEQWQVLSALLKVLRLSVAQLSVVFQERRLIDFCELGIAARRGLKEDGHPTDLAYRLDSRIDHLLMDEFQDTSRSQFDLIRQLTEDWQEGDGRTLFLVGDPMQSIYRFRQAEVGLFLNVEKRGLNIPLKPLQLRMNYRSTPEIVERVNGLFSNSSPEEDDVETGAIAYTHSEAPAREKSSPKPRQRSLFDNETVEETLSAVTWDIFSETKDETTGRAAEAQCVLDRIEQARACDPKGSIAILVRARTHLPKIIAGLKAARVRYRAFEVDPLAERPAVRDVLSLTRALLHLADRISWLAILRAPWCGLTLGDLETLVRPALDQQAERGARFRNSVWECLRDLSSLSPDGQVRAQRLRDVLAQTFVEQGSWPLRRWVERAWIALGGPAAIASDEQAREDVAVFFDLLEREQHGMDLPNLEQFGQRVGQVMERPPAEEDESVLDFPPVEVMTVHKAKGLQFDTVILPGLGQRTRSDDADLVLFHEWADEEDGREERLMAPISKKAFEGSYGSSRDQSPEGELYSYLKMIDARKEEQERLRQLYVAMTRAKCRLHVVGVVRTNDNGEAKPDSATILKQIWPWLADSEKAIKQTPQSPNKGSAGSAALRRLPVSWSLPKLPASVNWNPPPRALEVHEPSFEWAGESVRHAGTVVHGFLQRATSSDLSVPDVQMIRARLSHAGVAPGDLDSSTQRVQTALSRTFSSERGRWIFAERGEARSEYALAAVVDGEVVRGSIDRTFVDEQGVRWIVDFKTSTHEGGGLETFLDEQQRRYRDQMERYARILRPLGNPVRVGLYFPLLNEWREWEPAE